MSYYERHVFFCCNQRTNGKNCCNDHGAQELRDYAKKKVRAMGLAGEGKTRINQAGCLDRCGEGPVLVVYPEGVWYSVPTREDIDEVLQKHLVEGGRVERLMLRTADKLPADRAKS